MTCGQHGMGVSVTARALSVVFLLSIGAGQNRVLANTVAGPPMASNGVQAWISVLILCRLLAMSELFCVFCTALVPIGL